MRHIMVEYYDWTGENKLTSAPEKLKGDIPSSGCFLNLGSDLFYVIEVLPNLLQVGNHSMRCIRVMEVTYVH